MACPSVTIELQYRLPHVLILQDARRLAESSPQRVSYVAVLMTYILMSAAA